MPHAAVTQPAGQATAPMPQEAVQQERPPKQVSDLAIASAVAQAIRTAPEVVDLSPGLFALVATYGSGQRVAGVVVHHLTPDQIVLETRVILSEAHCNALWAAFASDSAEGGAEGRGILTDIASRIREVVYESLRDITSPRLAHVDVFIDDLR